MAKYNNTWLLIEPTHTKERLTIFEMIAGAIMFKGEYRLAPLKSELYAISTIEEEVIIEPEKKYSLYGEFSQ